MAKKQTRVSISISGLTAQRLVKLAKKLDEQEKIEIAKAPGYSTALEYLIDQECIAQGIPKEHVLHPREKCNTGPKPKPKPDPGEFFPAQRLL